VDIQIAAADGTATIELRDVRPANVDGQYRGLWRVSLNESTNKMPFWLDRADIEEFLREAHWLERSTGGRALLSPVGRSDTLILEKLAGEWQLGGQIFRSDHPDMHLRFRFPVLVADVRNLLTQLRELLKPPLRQSRRRGLSSFSGLRECAISLGSCLSLPPESGTRADFHRLTWGVTRLRRWCRIAHSEERSKAMASPKGQPTGLQ
jgi:hypothetical protein